MILVEHNGSFGLPDLLQDGLLGRLGGDTAEVLRSDFDLDLIAGFGGGIAAARVLDRDLIVLRRDLFHDVNGRVGLDVAGFPVHVDAQVPGRTDALPGGREQGGFHRLEKRFAVNSAFFLQITQYCCQFTVHASPS